MKKVNHWINGKNVAGNDYFQTTNPATGEVLADVASGGEAEINQAVAAAKEAALKAVMLSGVKQEHLDLHTLNQPLPADQASASCPFGLTCSSP